jgi:hypothetical protein
MGTQHKPAATSFDPSYECQTGKSFFFYCRLNLYCPVLPRKIFLLRFFRIYDLLPHIPHRHKGRIAIVTNVERNAVDAGALTDERRISRTVKSCGSGAPMQAPSLADVMIRKATVAKGWFTEKSAK